MWSRTNKTCEKVFLNNVQKMSEIGEEDQETYSGCITKKEQLVFIKIKC